MIVKGQESKKRAFEQERIGTSRNHVVAPGRHYALVDKKYGQGQSRRRMRKVAGKMVAFEDSVGYTQDPDIAAGAKADGFMVIEREQPVPTGKVTFTTSEAYRRNWDKIDWHHGE